MRRLRGDAVIRSNRLLIFWKRIATMRTTMTVGVHEKPEQFDSLVRELIRLSGFFMIVGGAGLTGLTRRGGFVRIYVIVII
ncbi:hypothetical protein B1A99_30595 [Cohnella sp. CIP 111063]|nr:hypothetical protein B1A99_30595 [Cohnella sp. CIP 111063]